ncbi:unnamed protein product, partial [marine sediment metagenome]
MKTKAIAIKIGLGVIVLAGIIVAAMVLRALWGGHDIDSLGVLGDVTLPRVLRNDIIAYEQQRIRTQTSEKKTEELQEVYEQAMILSNQQFLPWQINFRKLRSYGVLSVVCIGFLLLVGCFGVSRLRESSIVPQNIGSSTLRMHCKLAKQPDMIELMAKMIQVDGLKSENPDRYAQFAEKMLIQVDHAARSRMALSTGPLALPEITDDAPFDVPPFRELFHNGMIAPGKPLVMGFHGCDPQLRSYKE